jgi:hypothetical protein
MRLSIKKKCVLKIPPQSIRSFNFALYLMQILQNTTRNEKFFFFFLYPFPLQGNASDTAKTGGFTNDRHSESTSRVRLLDPRYPTTMSGCSRFKVYEVEGCPFLSSIGPRVR